MNRAGPGGRPIAKGRGEAVECVVPLADDVGPAYVGIAPEGIALLSISTHADASGSWGDKYCPRITVGGYMASLTNWTAFERAWSEVNAAHQVPAFHATDVEKGRGMFSCWSQLRRDDYRRQLADVVGAHLERAFTFSLAREDHDRLAAEFETEPFWTPYGLCGAMLIRNAESWARKHFAHALTGYIFESDDAGWDGLDRLLARTEYAKVARMFLPKRDDRRRIDGTIRYRRQFEAADFIAYEVRMFLLGKDGLRPDAARPIGTYLDGKVPSHHGLLRYSELVANCEQSRIPRRAR